MDIDRACPHGATVGLKTQFSRVTFDAIRPGPASVRYDIGKPSFTDTKEREEQVDLAT